MNLLNSLTGKARNNDPDTSRAAALGVLVEDLHVKIKSVLDQDQEAEGMTTYDIHRKLTELYNARNPLTSITPRMKEMEKLSLVERTLLRRKNPDTGRFMIVWKLKGDTAVGRVDDKVVRGDATFKPTKKWEEGYKQAIRDWLPGLDEETINDMVKDERWENVQ